MIKELLYYCDEYGERLSQLGIFLLATLLVLVISAFLISILIAIVIGSIIVFKGMITGQAETECVSALEMAYSMVWMA